MMPARFRGSAKGPIRVDVLLGGEAVGTEWPGRIKVISKLVK